MKAELLKGYKSKFKGEPTHFIRCGGRFEILGNHTDHNNGECIAATCDMSIFSACKKRDDGAVVIISKEYGEIMLSLVSLQINKKEEGTSVALVRGIAKYLTNLGYKIGGFNAYTITTIFKGAGVSSSAAFELLIGQIFNEFYNDGKIDRVTLAKAGQYAENVYYGKSCGLLDQIGVSAGGMVHIDFKNPESPIVEPLHMHVNGYKFILVNTGGDHARMSGLYSKIPQDMKAVAKILGVTALRNSSLEELEKNKDKISNDLYLRARHYFDENERVREAVKAIKKDDVLSLVDLINKTRRSCSEQLKNMMAEEYKGSPLEACDYVDELTNKKGAAKINGGGFAGSIVTLIPDEYVDNFVEKMKKKYGDKAVYFVNIDEKGVGNF